MEESTIIILHLIDGVLMLAMMALMFCTIRLLLNCKPLAKWLQKHLSPGKERRASGRRCGLKRRGRGCRPCGTSGAENGKTEKRRPRTPG